MSDLPEGMKWCPDCDGMGEIYYMDASPDMDEHAVPCRKCDRGLVPVEPGGSDRER
jgi:hypothetical protein